MTDYTAVNASSMAEGIAALSKAHKDLTSHLDDLEGNLNQSLAQWTGAAQAAYKDAQNVWDKAARHMQQVVNTMHGTLGKITEKYADTESKITASWQ